MTANLKCRGRLSRTAWAIISALLGLALGARSGMAQATLQGRVVDSETGKDVADATVRIKGSSGTLKTDQGGRFEAPDLKSGVTEVSIEALGYGRGTFHVTLPGAGILDYTFALDFTGYKLPEIVVKGRIEELAPRYMAFEERREKGIGAFLRWDDLLKVGSNTVGDALRTIRGVKIQCNQQTFECNAVMARSTNCHPTWWVDGVEVHSFEESTSIRDVYGIEVYRGPGEVPGEFAGSDAACGVIVVWTKSRPYRAP
jgi:hypothetical protein